ncbi:MAG: hypothetical protein C4330_00195 [Chitinophagaceae bacterium]
MKPIKAALCEDNTTFRESLAGFIEDTPGFEVIATFSSAESILGKIVADLPDIILMDIDMPVMNGIAATALIKEQFPQVNILILTVYEDDQKIFDAILATLPATC